MTRRSQRFGKDSGWRAALAWDGFLPMGLAAFTALLSFLYPADDEVEICSLIVLPTVVALLRASVGAHQLRRFSGASTWWRQLLLAIGIMLLWMMEAAAAAVLFTEDNPFWARLIPAGIYVCYLPIIILAFWRPAEPTSNSPSSS